MAWERVFFLAAAFFWPRYFAASITDIRPSRVHKTSAAEQLEVDDLKG
jgi:hypothetical protein